MIYIISEKLRIERQTCIYTSSFLRSGKNEVISRSLYRVDFISTNCKILYQFLLFAQSTGNLTDFLYFFIHIFVPICTIWKKLIGFLYTFRFLFLFRQFVLRPRNG